MAKRNKVEGFVWCNDHGVVHERTTDPYGYGKPDCRRVEHRLLYWFNRKDDDISDTLYERYMKEVHK